MKKVLKAVLCLALVAAFVASFAGCAKINYVTNGTIKAINEVKSGDWKNGGAQGGAEGGEEGGAGNEDPVVLEAQFEAGTYGGVEFASVEDVVNYYVEAYNYTKSLTAEYTEGGNTVTYYKLLGEEKMEIGDVMIDGKANSIVNNLVPSIMDSMFNPTPYGLVPCYNRNPDLDNNGEDEHKKNDWDFRTSHFTAEDVLACFVKDNGDGTITIGIQPKAAEMAVRGEDSQGRFFEVLGDIGGVVAQIDMVSFTQGGADENVKVTYKGGTGIVKIDTKTKEIVEGDYEMISVVNVTHASIAVIKDKSASLNISYKNHYPASDEFLESSKGIKRK
ncbi:MAG: hypothetical protein K6C14_04165 [Eubacterium sp.]|nr:hypothetical protein [Eubacterium sp.]